MTEMLLFQFDRYDRQDLIDVEARDYIWDTIDRLVKDRDLSSHEATVIRLDFTRRLYELDL